MSVKVRVNGEDISVDCSDVTDLAGLVDKIRVHSFAPGELIVSLNADGKHVDVGEMETKGDSTPLSDLGVVEIETIRRPLEKAAELLRGMGDYLGRLYDGAAGVADKFRMGSEEEANSLLAKVLDGLGVFTELVDTVKKLSKTDLAQISDEGGESLTSKEDRTLKTLKELETAQTNKDWVLVADVLEYDLAPLMNEWRRMLPIVEKELLKGGN